MKFSEVVAQTLAWLQREGRVSYRALKLEFDLTDEVLDVLKEELIEIKECAVDKDGKMLVWVQEQGAGSKEQGAEGEKGKWRKGEKEAVGSQLSAISPPPPTAERRQLTVMFCDLVDSTALSARLDPEDLRAVVQQYQQTCAEIIQRYEGHIAQYLGDGILVYFGYPAAHEDDAQRAVRAGLEIVRALHIQVPSPFQGEGQSEGSVASQSQDTPHPNSVSRGARELSGIPSLEAKALQVRIGIHTGLVVVGEIGSGSKREHLALGETPNIAARIQGLAEPNTVIVSAATRRLIDRQFASQPFGSHLLKGIDTPIAVYHVQSERQSTPSLAGRSTLTPLVGREQEVGLLIDRWEQAKEGRGQVVLLCGEPGIGKSRLAYTLREQVTSEGSLLFEVCCSLYHQDSAYYPLIDALQRTLLLSSQDSNEEKIAKLEQTLALYGMQERLPLFSALLSLPTPPHYAPLALSPQKQKERTLQVLLQLLTSQAERQATVSVWEDLHWADPSSLEFLSLLIEQIPTTNLLLVLTFRPEFTPPWKPRSHISQLVLNRLGKKQVTTMIEKVTAGKELSAEVIALILSKTDGVPLFVEEITKSVMESAGNQELGVGGRDGKCGTGLGIPSTLQEALLARLDRLSEARQVAQLGATLGREFSHELLQAVSPLDETDLHTALAKLGEAEILYQRGVGEQARYVFKHALIQDTAYQSLLKSTRQQYHQQIAHVLEERFPDTKANLPELLAHHYTEAGLIEQAIPCWQQAGQQASRRSANAEATNHLSRALDLLHTLPDTAVRAHQELTLQIAYGSASMAAKGYCVPEVEKAYTRARELCQQLGEAPQLFPILVGLNRFYSARAELLLARELGEQCVLLAERTQETALLVEAHRALGNNLYFLGELNSARSHLGQVIACYEFQQDHSLAVFYVVDPAVSALSYNAWTVWMLGYPDQAVKRNQEAIALAQKLSHDFSLGLALVFSATLHQFRRELDMTRERAEGGITLATERGFITSPLAWGKIFRGWVWSEQGQGEEGITEIRQGMAAWRATGAEIGRTHFLALLAEACGKATQFEEGFQLLNEAMKLVDKTEERFYEAELYRLKGELTLQRSDVRGSASEVLNPQHLIPNTKAEAEAEACFFKAIEVAQEQHAKSLELRASTSLARLWQCQGKRAEAYTLLSEVYNWFTEGFDTKDLQEAKALLDELS